MDKKSIVKILKDPKSTKGQLIDLLKLKPERLTLTRMPHPSSVSLMLESLQREEQKYFLKGWGRVPTTEKDKEESPPTRRRIYYSTLQFPSIKMIYNHPSCDIDLKEKIKSGYFNTDPDILKGIDEIRPMNIEECVSYIFIMMALQDGKLEDSEREQVIMGLGPLFPNSEGEYKEVGYRMDLCRKVFGWVREDSNEGSLPKNAIGIRDVINEYYDGYNEAKKHIIDTLNKIAKANEELTEGEERLLSFFNDGINID